MSLKTGLLIIMALGGVTGLVWWGMVEGVRALRRWRERREQEWLPIHVWAPVDNGGVSDYWALAGYKDAPGLRCMSQVPDQVQRWLLRDIKALGAQGAWDKHKPAARSSSTSQLAAALAPGLQQVFSQLHYTGAAQNAYVPIRAIQTAAQIQQLSGYQNGLAQQSALIQAAMTSGTSHPQAYQGPRVADPVRDPYLAANDLVDRLRDHLGLTQDAVASLSVKCFMLFVAIEAAKKDGEPWDDLDAALHEAAGIPYLTAEQRHATAAGALYLAEWAVVDGSTDTITLYMRADMAYVISDQEVDELGASGRVTWLRGRAPSAVTYTLHFDFADDCLVLTDGRTKRRLGRRVLEDLGLSPTMTAWRASQSALHSLWKAATPA